MPDYIVCTRAIKSGSFSSEPGPTRYLKVPDKRTPDDRVLKFSNVKRVGVAPRACHISLLKDVAIPTLSLVGQKMKYLFRSTSSVVLALVLTCCTLVSPYDPVIDKNINDVAIKTETALAKADNGQLTKSDQQTYFSESIGTVRATRIRSSLQPKNEDETEVLKALEERLQVLSDRGKPLRSSIATGLQATILDLQQIQTAKRRSATFQAGSTKTE